MKAYTKRKEIDKISEILSKPKFGIKPEEINTKPFKRKKIYK